MRTKIAIAKGKSAHPYIKTYIVVSPKEALIFFFFKAFPLTLRRLEAIYFLKPVFCIPPAAWAFFKLYIRVGTKELILPFSKCYNSNNY